MTKRDIVVSEFGGKNDKFPAYKLGNGNFTKAQVADNCVLDERGIPQKMKGRVQRVTLDNSAAWSEQYEANVLPDDPSLGALVWTQVGTFDLEEINPAGILHLKQFNNDIVPHNYFYQRVPSPAMDNEKGTTLEVKCQILPGGYLRIRILDGTRWDTLQIHRAAVILSSSGDTYRMDTFTNDHTYTFILMGERSWVYVDGILRVIGTPTQQTVSRLDFGYPVLEAGVTVESRIDYVYYMNSARIKADRIVSLHEFEAREGRSSLILATGDALVEIPDIEETTPQKRFLLGGLAPSYTPHFVNHFGKVYIFNGFNDAVVYNSVTVDRLDEDTTGFGVPIGRYPVIYLDRIFLFNLKELPNGYAFTNLVNSGSDGGVKDGIVIEPDYKSVGSDFPNGERRAWAKENRFELKRGRAITGAISWPESRAMLICQEDRLWIHEGGTPLDDQTQFMELKAQIGCLSYETLRIYKGMALFLGVESGPVGQLKGVFTVSPSGEVSRISKEIDPTFETIRIPVIRHNLATYQRDFNAGTYSDTSFVDDSVQLKETKVTGTWTSPIYYAEGEGSAIEQWGTFEARVGLDKVAFTNDITFGIRSASTRAGVSGAYNPIVDGQKITEAIANQYYQIQATLTRDDSEKPTPKLYMVKASWLIGGEWQESPWAIVDNDRYYLFFSDGTTAVGTPFAMPAAMAGTGNMGTKHTNRCLVFQQVIRRTGESTWEWTEIPKNRWHISCAAHLRNLLYGGSSKDDKIFLLNSTQTDDGGAITFQYVTGIYRAENPMSVNRLGREVYVETETDSADTNGNYDFEYSRDGGGYTTKAQTGVGTGRVRRRIALTEAQTFQEIQFRMKQTVNANFKIHGITVPTRTFPRRFTK